MLYTSTKMPSLSFRIQIWVLASLSFASNLKIFCRYHIGRINHDRLGSYSVTRTKRIKNARLFHFIKLTSNDSFGLSFISINFRNKNRLPNPRGCHQDFYRACYILYYLNINTINSYKCLFYFNLSIYSRIITY